MTITDYYVATDAMGSVTAILDDEGNVLERRSYDAFGEMTCMTPDGTPVAESPTSVDVGFQGQIRDAVSGLYQMGFRWHSPILGRWLSRDPIGLEGGGNLTAFVQNAPQIRADSMGLLDSATLSAPQLAEAGMTAKEISSIANISLAAALAAVSEATIKNMVNNFKNKSKGKDPCERAKDALRQAQKSLDTLDRLVTEHERYVANPSSYPKYDPKVVERMRGIENVKREWRDQIKKQLSQRSNTAKCVEILEEFMYQMCKCLHDPTTWFRSTWFR